MYMPQEIHLYFNWDRLLFLFSYFYYDYNRYDYSIVFFKRDFDSPVLLPTIDEEYAAF
jgi:hypothetical protein